MGIVDNALMGASGQSGYNLTRSLRFRSSASANLSRTPSSTGNQQKMTLSFWVKRGTLSTYNDFLTSGSSAANFFYSGFGAADGIALQCYTGSTQVANMSTTAVFRDPAAWYHIVYSIDTTQASSANGLRLYVNGVQQTVTISAYVQNANLYINTSGVIQYFGRASLAANEYLDGYLAEVNFIDGQALTPSSFGSTNTLTGVWQPARYTGTYGTNGFYLPFTDNSALTTSSNVGLGKDFSGNGNYWTTNNISITAGVTYDSMTDVPTLTSATAANFAVLNPLDKGTNLTASDGNLQYQITAATQSMVRSTFVIPPTGKWYWEATKIAYGNLIAGIATNAASLTNYVGSDAFGWGYFSLDGLVYNNGTTIRTGATLANGDILGIAFDSGAGSLSFYKNNVLQATAITGFTPATVNYFAAAGSTGGGGILNFGQRPFTYTPPTGFVALNTYNLPTSTIVKGNTVMDATLYTGNGSTQTITNAAGFKPDFVWIKNRNNVRYHILTDSVRGTNSQLFSNDTLAQETRTDRLTAFNSNGFSVGSYTDVNLNADTFVGWQWQAGQGTTSSNTSGTITSTVSVNASAGFSVVTYTGTNVSGATIGHGLGVAPRLIIIKNRSSVEAWPVYHSSVGATKYLVLNTTAAEATASTPWNNTAPTSTVFSLGNWNALNENGSNHVAYCWTPIAGYSAFGSYTGNGSSDGTFVYTGFRPKFVMIKGSSFVSNWFIEDSARNGYNVNNGVALRPNLSNAEDGTTTYNIDILSNGFKLRSSAGDSNSSGATFVYAAFAETPTKNALAR